MVATLAVGVDPGQMSGVAVVGAVRGQRPKLLGLWRVTGRGPAAWVREATMAWASCGVVTRGDSVPCWIEEPPPVLGAATRKAGGLQGDRTGLRSWAGLGRYQGRHDILARQQGLEPQFVAVETWTKTWGVIQRCKRDGGDHRVREAGMLVEGAGDALARLPESGRIDCAEAVLIAGAAALWTFGEAFAPGRT